MTTRELNNAVDSLIEQVEGYADTLTPGLGKNENHERLLHALIAAAERELQHLSGYTRPLRLQEDAADYQLDNQRLAA